MYIIKNPSKNFWIATDSESSHQVIATSREELEALIKSLEERKFNERLLNLQAIIAKVKKIYAKKKSKKKKYTQQQQ